MCRQQHVFRKDVNISSRQLRWSTDDPHAELNAIMSSLDTINDSSNGTCKRPFDRIIASDCMFFETFHDDLVWLLCAALAPDGVVYMLQPRRGRTMQRFLDKAGRFFDILVSESYDAKVGSA
jgi:predicted nicotinamide N-methyase